MCLFFLDRCSFTHLPLRKGYQIVIRCQIRIIYPVIEKYYPDEDSRAEAGQG
jgi:hypothetical protein